MKQSTFYLVGLTAVTIIASTFFIPGQSHSRSSGAPAGYTKSPADAKTCTNCHSGPVATLINPVFTTDIPTSGYTPGSTYNITFNYTRRGHTKLGFEISPQTNSGALLGTLINSNQTKFADNNPKYITHTSSSNNFTNGESTWSFKWTAPAAGTGTVNFYGTFLASNSNFNDAGDSTFYFVKSFNESLSTGLAAGTFQGSNSFKASISDNVVKMFFNSSTQFPAKITAYDINGKLMGSMSVESYNGSPENLVLSQYAGGVIFIHLIDAEGKIYSSRVL
jgi:hypothetical protein